MNLRFILPFALVTAACNGGSPGTGGSTTTTTTTITNTNTTTCSDIVMSVCGSDGKVWPNACYAMRAGVDLSSTACPASETPDHNIQCGTVYCDPLSWYCKRLDGDMGDTQWSCQSLPAACADADGATPDCSCFGTLVNGMVCSVVPGNGVSGLEIEMPAQ